MGTGARRSCGSSTTSPETRPGCRLMRTSSSRLWLRYEQCHPVGYFRSLWKLTVCVAGDTLGRRPGGLVGESTAPHMYTGVHKESHDVRCELDESRRFNQCSLWRCKGYLRLAWRRRQSRRSRAAPARRSSLWPVSLVCFLSIHE